MKFHKYKNRYASVRLRTDGPVVGKRYMLTMADGGIAMGYVGADGIGRVTIVEKGTGRRICLVGQDIPARENN